MMMEEESKVAIFREISQAVEITNSGLTTRVNMEYLETDCFQIINNLLDKVVENDDEIRSNIQLNLQEEVSQLVDKRAEDVYMKETEPKPISVGSEVKHRIPTRATASQSLVLSEEESSRGAKSFQSVIRPIKYKVNQGGVGETDERIPDSSVGISSLLSSFKVQKSPYIIELEHVKKSIIERLRRKSRIDINVLEVVSSNSDLVSSEEGTKCPIIKTEVYLVNDNKKPLVEKKSVIERLGICQRRKGIHQNNLEANTKDINNGNVRKNGNFEYKSPRKVIFVDPGFEEDSGMKRKRNISKDFETELDKGLKHISSKGKSKFSGSVSAQNILLSTSKDIKYSYNEDVKGYYFLHKKKSKCDMSVYPYDINFREHVNGKRHNYFSKGMWQSQHNSPPESRKYEDIRSTLRKRRCKESEELCTISKRNCRGGKYWDIGLLNIFSHSI